MSDGSAPAFSLTVEQLRAIVSTAVNDVMASRPATLPRLLDRNGIADVLGCSAGHVDKLRQRGMPCIRLGESPRFEVAACLEWLRGQK